LKSRLKGEFIMTIEQFIKDFHEKKIQNTKLNEHAVFDYIKEKLKVKTYIPFAAKRELCERVLNACNTRDGGLVKVDSVSRYIIFTLSIISAYTNIEFSSGEDTEFDSLDEYDMLCENHLLNPILEVIGEEYAACNNMLNMMMADIEANNNTVEAVLEHNLGKITGSIDKLINALAEKVEEMDLDLSQIDIDKYKGLIDLLPQK
jgi:hypothetical protein